MLRQRRRFASAFYFPRTAAKGRLCPLPRFAGAENKGTLAHYRHRNSVHARQGRAAGAACALARRARRNRPLGAYQARHRRLADRRFGEARQGCGRGAWRHRCAGHRIALARFGAALCRACSRGSKAAPKNRRAAIRCRFGRRCWRMRSTNRTSPRSTPLTSWPSGSGTASACRQSRRRATATSSRGSIRAPARISPKAFPI